MSWAKVGIGAPARKCTGNGAVGAEDCIPGHLLHPPYQYLPPYTQMGPTIPVFTTVPPDGTYCTTSNVPPYHQMGPILFPLTLYSAGTNQATISDEDDLADG